MTSGSSRTHVGQSGNDLKVLPTALTTRLVLADCLKARHKRFLNQITLTLTDDICSFDAPNRVDRVGVSAHNPGTLAGVTTHILKKEFVGIQTAIKHVRRKTKTKRTR